MKRYFFLGLAFSLAPFKLFASDGITQNFQTLKEIVVRAESNELDSLFHISAVQPGFPAKLELAVLKLQPNLDRRGVILSPDGATQGSFSGYWQGLWSVSGYPRGKDSLDLYALFNYTAWRDVSLTTDNEGNPAFETADDTWLDFNYEQTLITRQECEGWTQNGPVTLQFRGTIEMNGDYSLPYYASLTVAPRSHHAATNGNSPIFSDNPESFDYTRTWAISSKASQESKSIVIDQKTCMASDGIKVSIAVKELQRIAIRKIRFEVRTPF